MTTIALEIGIILLLLLANGVFAMTEMAVVASRKRRLRSLAAAGHAGAQTALDLAENPSRFLSFVQLGITLVGLLAGAFGGITIAEQLAAALQSFPVVADYAEVIGIAVVVLGLTYFSLIIGELVPKRIALANPEFIACRMARPMEWMSRLAYPLVRVLAASTELVMRGFRIRPRSAEPVSDEEVKALLQEGLRSGAFHAAEPRMVESVLALDERPIRDIMTPREKLVYLGRHDSHEAIWHKIVVSGHSNFPVHDGNRDTVIGVVSVKSVYANLAAGLPVRVPDLMVPAVHVQEDQTVIQLLEAFKASGRNVALVLDGRGSVQGLATLVDVLEAIVGEIPSLEERRKPQAVRRPDGSLLVDGPFALAKLVTLPEVALPTGAQTPQLDTVADWLKAQLGDRVREGATLTVAGIHFEIIDMDGCRIDKVLITRNGVTR